MKDSVRLDVPRNFLSMTTRNPVPEDLVPLSEDSVFENGGEESSLNGSWTQGWALIRIVEAAERSNMSI